MLAIRDGLQCLRERRLDDAATIFASVLELMPNHPDALHGMGLALLQRGQATEAAPYLSRASAIQPDNAVFHNNHSVALLASGQPIEAEAAARRAVQMCPDYFEAHQNLGLALFRQRRFADAEASQRDALRLRAGSATAHAALADAIREQGRIRSAIESYQEAIRLDSHLSHAHGNLGLLLLHLGQAGAALEHCRLAVELRPDSAISHNILGECLMALDRFEDALASFEQALQRDSRLPALCVNIGRAWKEMADDTEAFGWYQRALALEPGNLAARCRLAELILDHGNSETSAGLFRELVAERPDFNEARMGLGRSFLEQGDATAAAETFREAIRLQPEVPAHWVSLGQVYSTGGDLAQAESCFREALRLSPRHLGALANLATTLRGRLSNADQSVMETLITEPTLRPFRKAAALFGLAHVYDGRGQYDRAAASLAEANDIQKQYYSERRQNYDPDADRRHVEGLIAAFSPGYFARVAGWGDPTQRPVFIVGMPRSGTTLTEQILASHPRVFGAGERRFAALGLGRLPGLVKRDATPVECLADVSLGAIREAANWHLARLAELNPMADRVVDKMPDNYQLLGWIVTLFPHARIIHTRRDLRDVALSCWMTNFSQIRWANDLNHLAERIQNYQRLMAYWREILPGRFLEIDYEELVADLKGVSRRLIEWIELDWDPACLNFHRTERLVRTASVTQVREPIYTRSVGRWRHYESALKPLFERLNEGH